MTVWMPWCSLPGALNPSASKDLVEAVRERDRQPVLPAEWVNKDAKYFIDPTGRFVIGGPIGSCGLTGRRIIVDPYGGMARHGGGAFSARIRPRLTVPQPTPPARRRNIIAAGLADRCEIRISYAIGVARPTCMAWEPPRHCQGGRGSAGQAEYASTSNCVRTA
ncbi:methionine adenosyltransferase domain-containing protein [Escherichia coli]